MNYSMRDLMNMLRSNPDLDFDRACLIDTMPVPAAPVVKQSEHDLQVVLIQECAKRAMINPVWGYLLAIPTGGHRSKAVAGKLKTEGVKAGVPDLLWPIMRHGYGALWLELKISPNKPTKLQNEWLRILQAQGHFCNVIYDSVEDALAIMEWYESD